MVVDALSQKSYCNMLKLRRPELYKDFAKLNLGFVANTEATTMEIESTLEQDIRKGQSMEEKILEIKRLIKEDKALGFS